MSHFEFVIPLQRNELRNSAVGEYKVEEIVSFENLPDEIEKSIEAFNEEGCAYILENFDTLYSVLIHFNRTDWPLLNRIFDKLVLGSLNQLKYVIEPLVEDIPDSDTRTRTLNILKMNLYIFTQLHSATHDKIALESSTTVMEKGKGKRGKKGKIEELGYDWDEKQRQAFIALYDVLQLQVSKLWDPPVPEEQFVNMCANSCYKALEHPTIAHVKAKPLRDTLFQLLGMLIKRYSHGLSCVVKIVQLLTLFEHVVSPLANGVVMFVRDLGFKSLVNEIVRELMATTENTQDGSSIRSFSNFLVEVAELEPEIMIPTTKELTKYLEQDPYSMRCCVLSVMTEILLTQLSQDSLDSVAKKQRDLYLDLLEEHTLDNNAFVRSRVLQLYQKIVQHNAVPKSKFLLVVDLAIERVMDKSSNVCKNAISLLRSILEHNPYGVKLDMQQLISQLIMAEESLQSLERKIGSFKDMTSENIWDTIQPEIIVFLSSVINFADTEAAEESELTQLLTRDTLQENLRTIAILVSNRKFQPAFNLVKITEQAFPSVKDLKSDMPANNTLEYYLTLMREIFMMYNPPEVARPQTEDNSQEDSESSEVLAAKAEEDLRVQKNVVTYLMDCLEFSKKIEEGMDSIIKILNEESIAEVLEAINFITVSYQFGLPSAEKGVQEMIRLVFRKEPQIIEAVNKAYCDLYLDVPDKNSKREKAIEEVSRLSKLASSLDYGQIEALSHFINSWIKNNNLDSEFINVLWDRVKSQNISKAKKQTALVLLSMVTKGNPDMAKDNLGLLIAQGLNIDCADPSDIHLAVFTCEVISNIVKCRDANKEPIRFPVDYEMFPLLANIVKSSFTKLDGCEMFIRYAREAISVIMELCIDPIDICGDLLFDLFEVMISTSSEQGGDVTLDGTKMVNGDESNVSSLNDTAANPNETKLDINTSKIETRAKPTERKPVQLNLLLRFLVLVGDIAFKYSHFLENYYLERLKKKMRDKFKTLSPSKNSGRESSANSTKTKQNKGEEEVITEADLMAAADDLAVEEVRSLLDSQIVNGDGVIAGFSNLILEVCKNPRRYNNPFLKCVASSALTQVMMVSSVFCNDNMQLLVTMLDRSSEESVRLSLVISFGDLLFKFPNVVEPWTRFLYARLRDDSWKVRRNTLVVLSHLVTNEMVKVKGQISEVALCIVDKNEEIVDLAKRFFSELSQKGNTLYNVLPDIISHLSNPSSDIVVEEKDFEVILKYIMDQIQKEKQLENLVEKLCKRMKESLCERQWKDLAFCLSLLPWSDRSLRRLIDHATCFCDRLLYQPVATLFMSIVSSVSRSTKPGLKEIGAELNAIIDEVITKGSADHIHNADETMSDLPSKTPGRNPRKTPAKTPATRKTAKKKKVPKYISESEEESPSDSDKSGDEAEKEVFQQKKTTARQRKKLF
ncbi:condensin complex subunit 1 [Macrosteles quadrilineatus]|uniref:condensin complex subunit 1 n=1 Tax=Macrosteles quadrilineatus TaxID=74068 RepID=UPI0023E0CC2A|nr:condensin complex subunit 1 [Macrosteles quadrilineatus]XP_054267937.1 condensin complex subunit 1 [Macrosteles quadrilineatus]